MKTVFIHGRSQEGKNPDVLKKQWIDALVAGGTVSGREFIIDTFTESSSFPYYGDDLISLLTKIPSKNRTTEDIYRSTEFLGEVEKEIVSKGLASDEDGNVATRGNADDNLRGSIDDQTRGILNWKLVRGVLGGVDSMSAKASAAMISVALKDVAFYLEDEKARQKIDAITIKSLKECSVGSEPILVVAHSLGTVVAYSVLHGLSKDKTWKNPVNLVTVGSPLAIAAVKLRMSKKGWPPFDIPKCVKSWVNGSDIRDVVALNPIIDRKTFFRRADLPFDVVNLTDIDNTTSNRHGIEGYLGDASIARFIIEAAQS